MGEIVIEEMNYKAFLIVLANSFFLLAAFTMMIFGICRDILGFWLPGVMISIMLIIAFIGSLVKVLHIKKLLTITHEGIIDYSTIRGVGYISFDDIKEFKIVSINNKRAIAVIPKSIDSFLSKFNVAKQRIINRNLSMNLPPVSIFVDQAKDMEPQDILSLLQKRLADYSSLYE